MKKVREITGSKDIDLLKMDDLLKTTGYIRGGCSPLGMIRKYPTFIEETAQIEDYIYVSAGQRGLQLKLKPDDLVRAADARYADFTMMCVLTRIFRQWNRERTPWSVPEEYVFPADKQPGSVWREPYGGILHW